MKRVWLAYNENAYNYLKWLRYNFSEELSKTYEKLSKQEIEEVEKEAYCRIDKTISFLERNSDFDLSDSNINHNLSEVVVDIELIVNNVCLFYDVEFEKNVRFVRFNPAIGYKAKYRKVIIDNMI